MHHTGACILSFTVLADYLYHSKYGVRLSDDVAPVITCEGMSKLVQYSMHLDADILIPWTWMYIIR